MNLIHRCKLVTTMHCLKCYKKSKHILQRHETKWGVPYTKTVLTSVAEPCCNTLRETLTEKVTSVDPEEDLSTGQEILQKLPPQTSAVREHCISLFDDLAAATSSPVFRLTQTYQHLPKHVMKKHLEQY